ncbi:BspA family leucine-rich repeat surface protein [Mycoplasma feriruminatoris]|uniref:Lipoprotein n=1 Tax=Mycoplasma feriruminatoris TaxID=1179777 RepID=A0ABY8HXK3_9MOLU|nr:BspA family leucine-rich repeat surface protein [Mycoplasma feriruminatoris]WFQ90391.1 hypothetical protein MFERI11561_00645 [Mycoplasma feriruminatoris]WFQ93721.1 hypothetical protein MFERI15181_00641 [Mycoplasma feriruminatoris]
MHLLLKEIKLIKKLIITITCISSIATSGILVISCKNNTLVERIKQPKNTPNPKKQEKNNKTPESKKEKLQYVQPIAKEKNNSDKSNQHSKDNFFYYRRWNTSNVKNMDYMFYNAKRFKKNISGWNVSKTPFQTNFAKGSGFEKKSLYDHNLKIN